MPVQPQPVSARCELVANDIFANTGSDFQNFCKENSGDYVVSNSTESHLSASIRKVDAPVNYSFRDDKENLVNALCFVGDMFDECFRAPNMLPYEVLEETELKTSSGVIMAQRGLPKKGDCIRADLHNLEFPDPNLDDPVLWKVSGKVEPRTRHDYVILGKQRTFIIEPFEHLWHTKIEYGNQNKALKNKGFSAYGFNPYEGGVNRLALDLVKHKRFWMLDGKGWDRLLPHMREVYALRNKYKINTALLRWVYGNLMNSYLVCPNGDVIFKTWGNNSGSGNTTGDNILAMAITICHVFYYLGYTTEEIKSNLFVAIFGDDVVASDSFSCSDEKLKEAFDHVFTGLYGIVLDPFVIVKDITQLTFLGFTFCKFHDWYIPAYPLDKLCASAMGNVKSMNESAELGKLTSLMLMSAGHGRAVFDFFRSAVVQVIEKSDSEECTRLRSFDLDKVIPSYYTTLAWYIGWEGGVTPDNVLNIVYAAQWEGVMTPDSVMYSSEGVNDHFLRNLLFLREGLE